MGKINIKKIGELIQAWITALNPSEEEIKRAKYRAKICEGCEYKVDLNNSLLANLTTGEAILAKFQCNKCGCPLSKKIFPNFKEACPERKWDK